jgi:hypothetical protein
MDRAAGAQSCEIEAATKRKACLLRYFYDRYGLRQGGPQKQGGRIVPKENLPHDSGLALGDELGVERESYRV